MDTAVIILVVEDDEDIQELLRYNLIKGGYRPVCVASGEEALARLAPPPDLVLLDIMLPGMNGLAVLDSLKENPATAAIPVVMLTARGAEEDIVAALEAGADDYVVKPFSPRVLIARLEAVLRRRQAPAKESDPAVIEHHGLRLDHHRYQVSFAGRQISLTASEFAILAALMERPGWVRTRQQLLDRAKGEDHPATERLVDVQISNLRKKLGEAGRLIETVRGIGYRFRE